MLTVVERQVRKTRTALQSYNKVGIAKDLKNY